MMMKGSSSTFLCALVGLTVLLCVVNEAQGLQCYYRFPATKDGPDKVVKCTDVNATDCYTKDSNGKKKFHDPDLCLKITYDDGTIKKGCTCSEPLRASGSSDWIDTCKSKDAFCTCKGDKCNGATTPTRTLAFSTFLSASALAIIALF